MNIRCGIVAGRFAAVVVWAVVCVALTAAGHGQNALGDGRALDANPQRGSGGVNPQGQTRGFGAGNDVITGNVPGLGYFHDSVGYGASGSFGQRLGEDDLFRFRARSLSSTPILVPGGGYTLGMVPGQVNVYRSHTDATAADLSGPSAGGRWTVGGLSVYESSGLVVRPTGRRISVDGAVAGLDAFSGGPEAYTRSIGVVHQAGGRLLEVTATALLGVRHHDVGRVGAPTARAGASETPSGSETQEPPDRVPVRGLPAIELGWQMMQPVVDHQQRDRAVRSGDRPATEIEAELFRPLETESAHVAGNVYLDLLGRVQDSRPPSQEAAADEPGADQPAAPLAEEPVWSWLHGAIGDRLAQAQAQWRAARRRPGATGHQTEDAQGQSRWRGAVSPDGSDPLGKLLEKLDYDLPPVTTLAGATEAEIDRLMQRAQDEIRSGRYLDAQEHYHDALVLRPDDPMGRVGLIHAQIGAGMIRSAQVNMRRLFERHPELIAARYDASLLPEAQRLEQITHQLVQTVQVDAQGAGALMLAYLGYQGRSPRLVKFALDVADAQSPRDPLLTIVRSIWLPRQVAPDAVRPEKGDGPGRSE